VLCIGGSWLVPADALEAGDWAFNRFTSQFRDAIPVARFQRIRRNQP
jgi:2-dehydro-3-deoxyphosphogluconate aldolase/(4S)-4-hydroxy-2-oxoglutarate aldolase